MRKRSTWKAAVFKALMKASTASKRRVSCAEITDVIHRVLTNVQPGKFTKEEVMVMTESEEFSPKIRAQDLSSLIREVMNQHRDLLGGMCICIMYVCV